MSESDMVDDAWARLKDMLLSRHGDIAPGRMMTADALTCADKVFVFRSRRNGHGLGCKLGTGTPDQLGARQWKPLKPFRDKAAMRGWFVIGPKDAAIWPDIAEAALSHARESAGVRA